MSIRNIRSRILIHTTAAGLTVAANAAPVINEIMYRPGTGYPEDTRLEFIEIHNPDDEPVDLSDWAITTGADYAFPAGTTLAAGGFLVIASDPAALEAATGISGVHGPWKSGATLANNGESVTLSKPDGDGGWTTVDKVRYASEGDWATRTLDPADGWTWVSGADGGGKSLERRNPRLASTNGQNWGASTVDGGTPGAANTLYSTDIAPVITDLIHTPAVPTSSDPVTISCHVTDELDSDQLTVTLHWRNATTSSPGAFQNIAMTQNAAGAFTATLDPLPNKQIVEFYVSASDGTNTRTWPAPSSEGQTTNCTYQVDNEVITGSSPVYRLILTAAENAAYEELAAASTGGGPGGPGGGGPGGGTSTRIDADRYFNLTLIVTRGADTTIRYLTGMRIRGNSSRNYTIKPLRISIPNDNPWDGVTDFLIGPRGAPWQYLAHKIQRAAGLVAADASAIEVRRQGIEYAVTSGSTADYGKLARIEDINGDYVDNHWPDADDGQVYRKVSVTSWAYSGSAPATPDEEWSGWSKQNNKSANDWSDVMNFIKTYQDLCAPHFDGETAGDAASGTWDGTGFSDEEMATLAGLTDLDYLARWFAVMTIMPNNEPNISTGEDDDYAAAFIRSGDSTRMYLIPHDMDTTFGQGEETWGPTDVGLYDATETDTIRRMGTGAVTLMEPLLPLLGDSTRPGNAVFRAKYLTAIRELFGSIFDADTTDTANPPFYQFLDNHLGDWVPESIRETVKAYMTQRQAYLLGLIGEDKIAPSEATSTSTRTADATPALRINEVLTTNLTTHANGDAHPDIIELYNAGTTAIDLGGMRLGDYTAPTAYTFPNGTTIPAGGSLVVYADKDTDAPGLHTGFALDAEGDAVYLHDSESNGGALLDSIKFGFQVADLSIARTASSPDTWALTSPTIGAANGDAVALGDVNRIRINEWAGRIEVRTDKDFIELHNPLTVPVALGGVRITDDILNRPDRYDFRKLSFIGPGAFLVLDTDKLEYNLDGDFDFIFLVGENGAVIDRIDFNSQPEDTSTGRSPDGGETWANFAVPTPGLPNDTELPAAFTALLDGLRVTEIMYKPAAPSDAGDYEFIEVQNIGTSTLDLSGVRFTNGIDYTFPAGTTLAPNAYLVVCRNRDAFLSRYPSAAAVLADGVYSGALDNSGETIALTLPAPWDVHILKFRYEPDWYPATAGDGYSLVTVDPATTAPRDWDQQGSWSASATVHGNPGGLAEVIPVISSTTEAEAEVGTAFSYQITASGSPTSFGAAGLPAGLRIDTATGLISGTPVVSGTFAVTISATNATGTGSATLTLAVTGAVAEVSVTGGSFTYDGTAKSATVTTAPPGLKTRVTYSGSEELPVDAGVYAVVATVEDPSYTGYGEGTLEILPTVSLAGTGAITATAGGSAALSLSIGGGSNVSVQWQVWRNGTWVNIGEPGGGTLDLAVAQLFDTGEYRAVVSAGGTEVISETISVTVDPAPASNARLLNLSTRARCLTGENILIPGFVLDGSAAKKLLIRAVGPRLADFGLSDALPDPQMTLKLQTASGWLDIAANDNWSDNTNAAEIATLSPLLGAFELLDGSRDAVLLLDLAPGAYSVVCSDTGGETGVVMVELYDAEEAEEGARLLNISNRGYVGSGADVMIPGFVLDGDGPQTLLVRAIGPTLASYGIDGALEDPQLTVFRQTGETEERLLDNDNWGENGDSALITEVSDAIGAFALPEASRDAAFVITLPPGVYTVQAGGVNGSSGVALVEVYLVP